VPRAAVCHAFGEPLRIEPVELAPPGPGQVRVGIRACAICHSDVAYADGHWGGALPAVFGHEAAGVVLETGPGVDEPRAGDHVVVSLVRACGACPACLGGNPALCGPGDQPVPSPLRRDGGEPVAQGLRCGAFADEVVVHASQAVRVPPELPFASACLIGCAVLTGMGAVERVAQVQPGERVVVVGCGGVGLNAVQGAVLARAAEVTAIDVSPARLQAALAFGATAALPADGDLEAARGADHVIETAGRPEATELALRLVRRGGTVVALGMPASGALARIDVGTLANDAIRLLGSKLGGARPREDVPRHVERYVAGQLKLDELVSATWPLDEIAAAMDATRAGNGLRHVLVP
jgi:S-(hydroxymethyl)glutathione dehydrogenase / alcohol dehydrogenase